MPQMGESIAEGTLSRWLKKIGDEVKRDEPIFEISTDKVDAEIPAPTGGILAEVSVTEGQTVAVGTLVARIETDKSAPIGTPAATPAPAASPEPAAASGAASASEPVAAGSASAAAAPTTNGSGFEERIRTKSSPLVRKIAAEHGIEIGSLQGSVSRAA
jgi:2-oxoglutarate dehydrogenase E2 component (dihydrolipoamide succinyltransferase)